jgi:hypothetical protein
LFRVFRKGKHPEPSEQVWRVCLHWDGRSVVYVAAASKEAAMEKVCHRLKIQWESIQTVEPYDTP